jgi:apolipoprotein N-acyltransferase
MRASLPVAAAALLGVATVLGFAPFGLSALPVFTLAGLFLLWRHARLPPRVSASTSRSFPHSSAG